MFGVYTLDDPGEGLIQAPKLNCKKSRFGCQRCKARKVKCDEQRPKCQHCRRHGTPCTYDRQPDAAAIAAAKKQLRDHLDGKSRQNYKLDELFSYNSTEDPPESRERRLLEAGLMRHFVSKTGLETAIDEVTQPMISESLPEQSLKCDSLLYAMYSTTALHQVCSRHTENVSRTMAVHRKYLSMALREHQQSLGNITAASLDSICLTSAMLRVCAWAMLQTRPRSTYSPPMEWLMISGTATALHEKAWSIVKDLPESVSYKYLNSPSSNQKASRTRRGSAVEFAYLLVRDETDVQIEAWDSDTSQAYTDAVGFLSEAYHAMQAGYEGDSCRRLIIFPMKIRKQLLYLVGECQPRALLLLAHFFALTSQFDHFWWIGQGPAQEVKAIAARFSSDQRWKQMLEWPLKKVEARIST